MNTQQSYAKEKQRNIEKIFPRTLLQEESKMDENT